MKLIYLLGASVIGLSLNSQVMASVIAVSPPAGSSYTISLPNFAVTDIAIANLGSPFTDFVIGGAVPFAAGTPGPTTISETYPTAASAPFLPPFVYAPGSTFLLGVTSNLPGDAAGQEHLVLFTNNTFASNAKSIAFGTLFPNTNETTLINDLTTNNIGGDLFGFAGGDAITGPNGSIAFTPGDSFTAVAFSGGQIIGTGTSTFTTGVPEPATVTLLAAAICGIGISRRSRRRSAAA
jgi:hypothetical protein